MTIISQAFRLSKVADDQSFRRLLAGACLAASAFASSSASGAAALLPGYFQGGAASVGTIADAAPLEINLGTGASAGCPCSGTNGVRRGATAPNLSVGPLSAILSAGVNAASAYGLKTATTATSHQIDTVSQINLLGGMIRATTLVAQANVSATPTALAANANGSKFLGLTILGQPIPGNVAPNTTVPLPGIGTVTIFYVNPAGDGKASAGVDVEMLRVNVSQANNLGLPVGLKLVVGEAFANFNRAPISLAIAGNAKTLTVVAKTGSSLQLASGAGGFASVPNCVGSQGKTITSFLATPNLGGLLSIEAGTASATSGFVNNTLISKAASSVGKISVLGGLITADGVQAQAAVSRLGGLSTPSALGTNFGNLAIVGLPIPVNVQPDTEIPLVGLGYVILNQQYSTSPGQAGVNGLHIYITLPNTLGLPVGTEILLAHAESAIAPLF